MRAATSMFLMSFAKSLPRLASITAFLCFVVAHLEWPDICLSPSRNPSLKRTPEILQGPRGPAASHHVHEERVHPVVAGEFGMERGGEGSSLAHGDDMPFVPGQHLDVGADRLHPGSPDEDALHRIAVDPGDVDRGLEGLVLA